MGLVSAVIGSYSHRQVKKLRPAIDEIEELEPTYQAMSDAELREQTDVLKARLESGETLDDVLPDAFAVVREASVRVNGQRPFRVQLIGGMILHQGRIAEMKTGEGKTLVATLPAYLNALTGESVHIITVNDYLARFQSEWMGKIYNFLGMTVGLVVHDQSPEEKHAAYNADITYGTNNEFGFDYLRDNMVPYKEMAVQRGHAFAIVDEVDSILIDEARTPLIISGQAEKSNDLYTAADRFVKRLKVKRIKEINEKEDRDEYGDEDYIVDEKAKTAVLTPQGIKKAEQAFSVDNLSDPDNSNLHHHITMAIRAHGVMQNDVDYVVRDGQVLIVDTFTGRILPGRRFSDGLHQALEAKENVKIENESKTLATITFQNYFRLYTKLSGMTGTALTEEEEFREIFSLDVVEVPTNKPMIRKDNHDVVYKSVKGKYDAIIRQIVECHGRNQPVLVGTVSIEKSEIVSNLLKRTGIPHNVLNAKQHEREAEIVAQAGKPGAVTIATNMAGRGTDIILGGNSDFMAKAQMRHDGCTEEDTFNATNYFETSDEAVLALRKTYKELNDKIKNDLAPGAEEVKNAGGLFIIGTERHESRRIDNQLRGRSGRQGDPGESQFFLSLEDDLMRLFGSERVAGLVDRMGIEEDQPIDAHILSNSIETAQKRLEGKNFERRKYVLSYDDVMNQQRKVIYDQRREVLDGESVHDKLLEMVGEVVASTAESYLNSDNDEEWNLDGLVGAFYGWLLDPTVYTKAAVGELKDKFGNMSVTEIAEFFQQLAREKYDGKVTLFGPDMPEVERAVLLRNVDTKWMDHIDAMDSLIDGIGLRAYAQQNPIVEFRLAGADMFDQMIAGIKEDTVHMILSVMPRRNEEPIKRVAVGVPTAETLRGVGGEDVKKKPVRKTSAQKVGRNDPCPCGSGKKYKKCCGAGLEADAAAGGK